jgi:hypothetical protein
MDALERVTVFMTLMRQLALVMGEERRLLVELRLDDLSEVQADKALLIEAYEMELRRLRAEPELIALLEPAVRAELHVTMQAFQQALADSIGGLMDAREKVQTLAESVESGLARATGTADPERPRPQTGEVIRVRFEGGGFVRLA